AVTGPALAPRSRRQRSVRERNRPSSSQKVPYPGSGARCGGGFVTCSPLRARSSMGSRSATMLTACHSNSPVHGHRRSSVTGTACCLRSVEHRLAGDRVFEQVWLIRIERWSVGANLRERDGVAARGRAGGCPFQRRSVAPRLIGGDFRCIPGGDPQIPEERN